MRSILTTGNSTLPAVMDRLKKELDSENIFRTDEGGTIEFITDGEELWVRVESKHSLFNSPALK